MTQVPQYLVFSGEYYEANGGWGDFTAFCDTQEEAEELARVRSLSTGWAHVVDIAGEQILSWYDDGRRHTT